jgi:hypothetical protein
MKENLQRLQINLRIADEVTSKSYQELTLPLTALFTQQKTLPQYDIRSIEWGHTTP